MWGLYKVIRESVVEQYMHLQCLMWTERWVLLFRHLLTKPQYYPLKSDCPLDCHFRPQNPVRCCGTHLTCPCRAERQRQVHLWEPFSPSELARPGYQWETLPQTNKNGQGRQILRINAWHWLLSFMCICVHVHTQSCVHIQMHIQHIHMHTHKAFKGNSKFIFWM